MPSLTQRLKPIARRISDLEAVQDERLQPRALRDYRTWNEPLLGKPDGKIVFRIGETEHHPAHLVQRLPGEDDDSYWLRAEAIALSAPTQRGIRPLPSVETYFPPDLGG